MDYTVLYHACVNSLITTGPHWSHDSGSPALRRTQNASSVSCRTAPDKTLTQHRGNETHTRLLRQLGLTLLEETACDGNYCVFL